MCRIKGEKRILNIQWGIFFQN